MIKVLHNPRCGKSRNCLAFLADSGRTYEVIKYLEQPLTVEELTSLLQRLQLPPIALVRQKEAVWNENYQGKTMSNDDIFLALSKHPILIERPIILLEDSAVIARDLDRLPSLLLSIVWLINKHL